MKGTAPQERTRSFLPTLERLKSSSDHLQKRRSFVHLLETARASVNRNDEMTASNDETQCSSSKASRHDVSTSASIGDECNFFASASASTSTSSNPPKKPKTSASKKKTPKRNPEVPRGREKKNTERRDKRHARIDQHAQVHDGVGVVEGREEAVGLCQRWIKKEGGDGRKKIKKKRGRRKEGDGDNTR
jgi:hypothetical protein